MPPQLADPEPLNVLMGQAIARARDLGHRLQVFRAAKHDPLCCVSFCNDCRYMVIVSVGNGGAGHGSLLGYALEVPCAAHTAAAGPRRLTKARTR